MKKLWPEILVLVLFLLGDLLWDGLNAAFAGVTAGILAFSILLCFKKKKPALLVEGLLFGGITALGEFVDYPGGNIILMEVIFGVILLVSAFSGKNLLMKMAGGLAKGLFSESQARILSMTLSSVLLLHSTICTILALTGLLSWWLGAVLFFVIYMIALRLSQSGMKKSIQESKPVFVETDHDSFVLKKVEVILGEIRFSRDMSTMVITEVVSIGLKPHEFLRQLEIAAKLVFIKNLNIENWELDEIELEMQGFSNIEGVWKKRI